MLIKDYKKSNMKGIFNGITVEKITVATKLEKIKFKNDWELKSF